MSDAIDGVIKTLLEAGLLVFLTIFIFLQDWRGTLIPTITIPVSLIGTFALMSAFGITINLISLFGLVLAIAIVVDDAIVVVENVWRIMEQEGVGPREAAIKAMEELGGAIAGVTLTLMSVFVPASFLPGITGQIYQQFALVLASATAISAINALTLTPALCAILLRKPQPPRFFLFRWFNSALWRADRAARPAPSASWCGHKLVTVLLFLVVFGARRLGLHAPADRLSARRGPGLRDHRRAAAQRRVARPHAGRGRQVAGGAQGRAGGRRLGHHRRRLAARQQHDALQRRRMYLVYKGFAEREAAGLSQEVILAEVRSGLRPIESAFVFVVVPPAIPGLGVSGGFQMQLQLQGGSTDLDLLAPRRPIR